jgi:hypothetical protein
MKGTAIHASTTSYLRTLQHRLAACISRCTDLQLRVQLLRQLRRRPLAQRVSELWGGFSPRTVRPGQARKGNNFQGADPPSMVVKHRERPAAPS